MDSQPQVILLHGIWMRGIALMPLAHRLRAAGFAVELFDYASVFADPERATASLLDVLRQRPRGATVHLVGHSLGGLIALQALRGADGLPAGRIVCLGSPLNGSGAARAFADWPGGRWAMGRSAALLGDGVPAWSGAREVGVIAGSAALGLGALAGPLRGPHDGTVTVAETRLAGIRDHRVVVVSHTGLLLSQQVADLTASFLQGGRFPGPHC